VTAAGNEDITKLAKRTLMAICKDAEAPASAKAQAARTLLEAEGALERGASRATSVPAAEMTAEQLDKALAEATNARPAKPKR
jgi:dihydroorotase-like cyclic amidohydrolase